MNATHDERGHLVVLDRGEELMSALTAYVTEQRITAGSITGIGAVRDTKLGYYDVETNEYRKHAVPASCEIASFMGNIATVDGAPFIHAHVVLTQSDFSCVSGHCFAATISVTGEFVIHPRDYEAKRFPVPGMALKTIDLTRS